MPAPDSPPSAIPLAMGSPHMTATLRIAALVAGLCSAGVGGAQTVVPAAAASAASAADAQVHPKFAPLLAFILGKLADVAFDATIGKPDGMFSRLKDSLGASDQPAAAAAESTDPVPAVGYAMQQLDPVTFDVLRTLEVGEAPTVLKTGDVFAIQYSTNLPGQIRLENVDSQGVISDLGTYTVMMDKLNRLPRTRGIRLDGAPGLELLNLYFYPCLPLQAAGQPWAEPFESKLPQCGDTPNPQMVAAASGRLKTRRLTNLSQPDGRMSFAGVAGYRNNEVTLAVVRIDHEARGEPR
jgi:hypothetical protein